MSVEDQLYEDLKKLAFEHVTQEGALPPQEENRRASVAVNLAFTLLEHCAGWAIEHEIARRTPAPLAIHKAGNLYQHPREKTAALLSVLEAWERYGELFAEAKEAFIEANSENTPLILWHKNIKHPAHKAHLLKQTRIKILQFVYYYFGAEGKRVTALKKVGEIIAVAPETIEDWGQPSTYPNDENTLKLVKEAIAEAQEAGEFVKKFTNKEIEQTEENAFSVFMYEEEFSDAKLQHYGKTLTLLKAK